MNDGITLTPTRSINRRMVLLALALVTVAGVVSAKTMFVRSTDNEPPSRPAMISNAASQISRLEQTIRDRPDDSVALTALASAYVQRARETGDPSFYPLASTAVQRALAVQPDDPQSL